MGEARKARQKYPASQRAQPIKQHPKRHPTQARKNPLKKKLRGLFICTVA
jgi:hypothetical protein